MYLECSVLCIAVGKCSDVNRYKYCHLFNWIWILKLCYHLCTNWKKLVFKALCCKRFTCYIVKKRKLKKILWTRSLKIIFIRCCLEQTFPTSEKWILGIRICGSSHGLRPPKPLGWLWIAILMFPVCHTKVVCSVIILVWNVERY